MIRHIVLTRFKPGTDPAEVAAIYAGLSQLVDRLPGATGFTGGQSQSPEAIERGYMHGFVIDFGDWDDLKTYADHPDHQTLGARLVANAVGGIDEILVLDIPCGQ
jgi:hypothetical protein